MEPYKDQGPLNCDVDFDTSYVKGKTAIVTGGEGFGASWDSLRLTVIKEPTALGKPMSESWRSRGKLTSSAYS